MSSLQEAVRDKILTEVIHPHRGKGTAQPNNANGGTTGHYKESQWKVLVLDRLSTRMVSACCKMHQIMAEGITLVEDLTKVREPLPALDAIYLITPTNESINMLLSDFAEHGKWTYRAAHVYFTEAIPDDLFSKMCKHPATKYKAIKTLKEINCAYLPYEKKVFSLDSKDLFNAYYSPERALTRTAAMERAAEQIATVCVSLGEFPAVRYRAGFDKNGEFATMVHNKLVAYKADDPTMGEGSNKDKSQLIILDRGFDPLAPLLHDLGLQSMAYDILPIENDVFTFTKDTATGYKETSVILDESDDLWVELRHMHIANATQTVTARLKEFSAEKKMNSGEQTEIKDVKQMVKKMPQYQKELNHFTTHITLASQCMELYRKKLNDICRVEQELVCGSDKDWNPLKDPMRSIVPIMLDNNNSLEEKLRVILLYVNYKGGVTEENFTKLLQHGRVDMEEKAKMLNLQYLGVPVVHPESPKTPDLLSHPFFSKFTGGRRKQLYTAYHGSARENKLSTAQMYKESRWFPYIKDLLKDACTDALDTKLYPYLSSSAQGGRSSSAPVSARARYNWSAGRKPPRSGPRVIFFIVGGMTYSEMRMAYEVAKESQDRDILIGSSHIITADDHLNDIRNLTGNETAEDLPPPM